MRGIVLVVVASCGAPEGRSRDPHPPVMLPDISTGSSTGADPERLDLPAWPDLPPGSTGEGSSGDEESSTGGSTGGGSTGSTSTGPESTGEGSSGDASSSTGSETTSTGSDESTGGGSTGPEPSGCPCAPGIDNFCDLSPGACPATEPGGYCDPDGNGDYLDGDFNAGYLAWKTECT
jgi:hypothetical protein